MGWKRYSAENAGAHTFRDRFDRASLSGPVAALKYKDDSQALVFHPVLELAEFDLKFAHFLFVFLADEFRLLGSLRSPRFRIGGFLAARVRIRPELLDASADLTPREDGLPA